MKSNPTGSRPAPAPPRPAVRGATPWLIALACAAALVALVAAIRPGHLAPHAAPAPGGDADLDLGDYTVATEARPIQGLGANVSGLTYSRATGTLFVAINRPPAIAELDLDGRLLRRLALPSAADPEGISHVEGDLFVVSDESDNSLHWVRVGAGDATPRPVAQMQLPLDFWHWHNLGLEGVSWDETRAELLVANEKWPRRVVAVRGLRLAPTPSARDARLTDWRTADADDMGGSDLSSLTTSPRSGNLLLLSDESARVTEYSRTGVALGTLDLRPGSHGLTQAVPQPEGLTLGPDGALYIVSEPNLFYRFLPRKADAAAP